MSCHALPADPAQPAAPHRTAPRCCLQGGSLTATLLLGDPSAPAGLQWQLGTLDLGAGEAAKAGPKQLTAGHQAMSNAQPPIAHMFVSAPLPHSRVRERPPCHPAPAKSRTTPRPSGFSRAPVHGKLA
jgi:hypothetical protein